MEFSNLQSRVSSTYIPPHRTQLHPRMHSFSSLSPPKTSPFHSSRDKWLIIAAVLFIITFLFYMFSVVLGLHKSLKFGESKPTLFGVVIDAGPSRSRVRVFEFINEGMTMTSSIGLEGTSSSSLSVRPGLLQFSGDWKGAGKSIMGLIEFATKRIPKSEWKSTKVQLMVTGELEKLEHDSRNAILESCRRVLRASGFLFKDEWASIMKGEEEGLYAWVAANYALGTLGEEPQGTNGIVELSGASMQVVFSVKDPPQQQQSRVIKLAGVTYNLYARSMPQYGQDAIWESLGSLKKSKELSRFSTSRTDIAMNPCIPPGYNNTEILSSQSVGNFSACKSEVLAFLRSRQDTCVRPPCETVSSFSIGLPGKPVPPDNLFYISEVFGLVPKASISDLEAAGRHYCEDDWNILKNQHTGVDDVDLLKYCLSSAYIVALLHESMGVSIIDERIGFGNKDGRTHIDWTLGAFLLQTMKQQPLQMEEDEVGEIVGNDGMTYFTLFAVLVVVIIGAFLVLKWQKPQMKTVYDLEKGRYIVTHVPR